jgi:hypothetical protein
MCVCTLLLLLLHANPMRMRVSPAALYFLGFPSSFGRAEPSAYLRTRAALVNFPLYPDSLLPTKEPLPNAGWGSGRLAGNTGKEKERRATNSPARGLVGFNGLLHIGQARAVAVGVHEGLGARRRRVRHGR